MGRWGEAGMGWRLTVGGVGFYGVERNESFAQMDGRALGCGMGHGTDWVQAEGWGAGGRRSGRGRGFSGSGDAGGGRGGFAAAGS